MTDRIYIQFADNGNIRKWQRDPFEGGAPYLASLLSDDEVGRVCERLRSPLAISGEHRDDAAALIQSQAAELAAVKAEREASIGVGDGSGQLFVHGSYDAVKAVQQIVFRAERAEAALAEARKALEPFAAIADTEDEVGREDPDDDRVWVVQAHGCQIGDLTVEHFRAARRAHSKDGGERNG